MADQPLRPIVHPGQSDTLVHFCGRMNRNSAPEVAFMSAAERLSNIVAEEQFRAYPAHGARVPTVSFSESDRTGVEALLAHFKFEGWGIVVTRRWAWDAGGGPVWYARTEMWERLRGQVDADAFSFMVRTAAGDADWFHEREWRVPCPAQPPRPGQVAETPGLGLRDMDVVALLVSDPYWEPRLVPDVGVDPVTGGMTTAWSTPEIASSVPRWCWDGRQVTELAPLPARYELDGSWL